MTRDFLWDKNSVNPKNNLGFGVCILVYSRRANRYCFSKLFLRHCTSRHILCSSPFSLRFKNRGSICVNSCTSKLISFNYRINVKPRLINRPIFYYVPRCKFNFFPNTFFRPSRNTAAIRRLSRFYNNLKYGCKSRVYRINSKNNFFCFYYLRGFCQPSSSFKN